MNNIMKKSALNKINFTQLNDEIMNVITKENKVNDAGAKRKKTMRQI